MVARTVLTAVAAMGLAAMVAAGPAAAAGCKNSGNFGKWLSAFKKEAAAAGISDDTISSALDGIGFDQATVDRDRRQSVFSQTFLEFSDRMVNKNRITRGAQMIKKHAATFAKVEKKYGVPAPVIVAYWGLETDFGGNVGDMRTIRSLATLAFDCRRPEKFRAELLAALRIIDRGDLSADQMVGAWAGELGHTQFLPSYYLEYGVDFDGDGHVNLLRSVPDVLASSANLLKHYEWRRGEPWLEEVRVPAKLPWEEADIAIKHPRSQWAKWGVKAADGGPLERDALEASLLLPMGRKGPAFLAYHNFTTSYLQWNESLIYSTTAAYYASRLAGAGPVHRGGEVVPFGYEKIKELQRLLTKRGFEHGGEIDGKLGAQTRAAVKAAQQQYGLPADSYPTPELMAALAGGA